MTIRRCVIGSVSDDTTLCQKVQVHGMAGEILNDVDHVQPYGFSARPMPIETDGRGAEGLLVEAGGGVRQVVSVQDRRYRPHGDGSNQGDVSIYHYRDDPTAANAQSATARATFTDDGDDAGPVRFVLRVGGATIEVIGADPARIYIDTSNAAISLIDDTINVEAKDVTINTSGDVSVTADGDVTVDALGNVDVSAAAVSITAASISLGA